jgi:hypothetical protein
MTSVGTVISYPIPLYANFPINADFYEPSRFVITAITLGATTTVTTSVDHNYVVGQKVRLLIPAKFGSYQLNETQGDVLSIPSSTQVEVSINSLRNVDSFISATATTASPQILAIGDINSGIISTSGSILPSTNIPGSFINISPQ